MNRSRYCVSVVLFCLFFLLAESNEAATLLGQPIQPGKTLEIKFPVGKYFQEYAAQGGNPMVSVGRAVLMFPKGFDPTRPWPILIVNSTSDANRTSPMDAIWYDQPATAEGWIVLASDATIKPREDTTFWRLGMLAAALEALRKEWPQSAKWPIAFAGLSGGAKGAGSFGVMLATTQSVHIIGFFLCGINEDRLSAAYKSYHPTPALLDVPIWLSSGMDDKIAPLRAHEHVKTSLEATGFRRVRVEPFAGGHQIKPAEVQRALRWFREVGRF